jgi:hypothetical protein
MSTYPATFDRTIRWPAFLLTALSVLAAVTAVASFVLPASLHMPMLLALAAASGVSGAGTHGRHKQKGKRINPLTADMKPGLLAPYSGVPMKAKANDPVITLSSTMIPPTNSLLPKMIGAMLKRVHELAMAITPAAYRDSLLPLPSTEISEYRDIIVLRGFPET